MAMRRWTLIALAASSMLSGAAVASPVSSSSVIADPVLFWNGQLLDSIRQTTTPPPKATRAMATMHTAVFDALNAANGGAFNGYAFNGAPASPADGNVAAAVAAHKVLTQMFPGRAVQLDQALSSYLATQQDTPAAASGASLGLSAANAVLAKRANDKADAAAYTYVGGGAPGEWRPTAPDFANGLLPGWGEVTPWAMKSGDQFRAPPPPALDSQAYADAVNEVRAYGAKDSTVRSADQTQIATFWADGGGTATPPGHWLQIAEDLAFERGQGTMDNARMFALLSMSVADAAISAWDTKYRYGFWRPQDAIRLGDTDGNPLTGDDDFWTPLLKTPNHPSYTSGHSTFSAASATALSLFFGTDAIDFCTADELNPGISRCFSSFWAAANEAGMSRIFGGIHYSFDNFAGLDAGARIARNVFGTQLAAKVTEPETLALFGLGLAGMLAAIRRRKAAAGVAAQA